MQLLPHLGHVNVPILSIQGDVQTFQMGNSIPCLPFHGGNERAARFLWRSVQLAAGYLGRLDGTQNCCQQLQKGATLRRRCSWDTPTSHCTPRTKGFLRGSSLDMVEAAEGCQPCVKQGPGNGILPCLTVCALSTAWLGGIAETRPWSHLHSQV